MGGRAGGAGRVSRARAAIGLALAVVGSALALGVGSGESGAVHPGRNGRITFSTGGCQHTVEPDGTDIRLIGDPCPVRNWEGFWSPDGTRLALLVDRGLWGGSIVSYAADGSDPIEVADEFVHELNGWSPNGDLLAWVMTRDPSGEPIDEGYALVHPDGTFTFIPGTADLYDASLSPDGTRIAAFASDDLAEQLVTLAVDGSDRRTVLDLGSGTAEPQGIDWSPDGSQLAFGAITNACGGVITVVGADGSGVRELPVSATCNDYDPAWSPDGTMLAFIGEEAGQPHGLYVMDAADGTDLRLVATYLDGYALAAPNWQPLPEVPATTTTTTTTTTRPGSGLPSSTTSTTAPPGSSSSTTEPPEPSSTTTEPPESSSTTTTEPPESPSTTTTEPPESSSTTTTEPPEPSSTTTASVAPSSTTTTAPPPSSSTTTPPPAPALSLPGGVTLTPGGSTTLALTGLLPGSTFTVTLFSDPVHLGTFPVGADGTARVSVTIPARTAAGSHALVVEGTGPSGPVRLELPVLVGQRDLPRTGATSRPLAGAGLATVALGLILTGTSMRAPVGGGRLRS